MNMSYCRFQNTARDLADCIANIRTLKADDKSENTNDERYARARIVRMAAELLAELGVEDIYDDKLVDRAIDDLNASDEGDEGDEGDYD